MEIVGLLLLLLVVPSKVLKKAMHSRLSQRLQSRNTLVTEQ
jgi:hypothetical protein